MFIRHSLEGKTTILIVYVDEIILTEDNLPELKNLRDQLASESMIKDLGYLKYLFGPGGPLMKRRHYGVTK